MKFGQRKRRAAPGVIIISLIDVLMVVLIFLLVTTTFKQHPSLKLSLPSSKQPPSKGTTERALVVTVPKTGPIYLGTEAVTVDKLQARFVAAVKANPKVTLSIRADTEAPFGQIVKVMDTAKAANLQTISAFTKSGAAP